MEKATNAVVGAVAVPSVVNVMVLMTESVGRLGRHTWPANQETGALEAVSLDVLKADGQTGNVYRLNCLGDHRLRNTSIDQRSDGHVARNAGHRIEIQMQTTTASFMQCLASWYRGRGQRPSRHQEHLGSYEGTGVESLHLAEHRVPLPDAAIFFRVRRALASEGSASSIWPPAFLGGEQLSSLLFEYHETKKRDI
jgi:hypothetical protein